MSKQTKKRKKINSEHFMQDIQQQIDEAEQAQIDLVEVQYKKQQETNRIQKMISEKEMLIKQMQVQLTDLQQKKSQIKKEVDKQLEIERKIFEEEAKKNLAPNQLESKYHAFLETFRNIPIGCNFETIISSSHTTIELDNLDKPLLIIGDSIFFIDVFSKKIIVLKGQLPDYPKTYQIISVDQLPDTSHGLSNLIKKKLKSDKIKLPKEILHKLSNCVSQPVLNNQQSISLQLIRYLSDETKRQLILKYLNNSISILGFKKTHFRKTLAQEILYQYMQLLKSEIFAKNDDEREQIFTVRKNLLLVICQTAGIKKPPTQKLLKLGWFRKTLFKIFPFIAPKPVRQKMTALMQCVCKATFLQKNVSTVTISTPAEKLEMLNFIEHELTNLKNRQADFQQKLSDNLKKRSVELKQPINTVEDNISKKQTQLLKLKQEKVRLTDQLEEIKAEEPDRLNKINEATQRVVSLKLLNAPQFEEFLPDYQSVLEQSKDLLRECLKN